MARRLAWTLTLLAACAVDSGAVDTFEDKGAKTPGWTEGQIISDAAFSEVWVLSPEDLKTMLRLTPWGPSYLMHEEIDGRAFADVLHQRSVQARINPLVLLTLLQSQRGLLSNPKTPETAREIRNQRTFAFGCTCWGGRCRGQEGLGTQLECVLGSLREGFDSAGELETSLNGYAVGQTSRGVTPLNRATVALLNVTDPELFRSVFERLVTYYEELLAKGLDNWLELPAYEGFVGGGCQEDKDCLVAGGRCELSAAGQRICVASCDSGCPHRPTIGASACAQVPLQSGVEALCAPSCDRDGGCQPGFVCIAGEQGSGACVLPSENVVPTPSASQEHRCQAFNLLRYNCSGDGCISAEEHQACCDRFGEEDLPRLCPFYPWLAQ